MRGGGGKSLSTDTVPYNSSGIGLHMENHIEMVLETQVNQFGRESYVKVLAVKRVLNYKRMHVLLFWRRMVLQLRDSLCQKRWQRSLSQVGSVERCVNDSDDL